MCRAFTGDAHIDWLLPEGVGRDAARARLFEHLLARMDGEVHASRDGKAAALWFTPLRGPGWSRQAAFFLRLLADLGPAGAISRGLELKRMERRHPERPHYYLQLIAVDPDFTRQGRATALLGALQARADASGHPVYLETSSQDNLDFYVRRAYSVRAETMLAGNLRLWSLVREPSPLA
jgi:GNAT superfamily N-acetyltransferase